MASPSIRVDVSAALAGLQSVRTDQIPFATAKALTNTAMLSVETIKRKLPAQFRLRNTWTLRGVGWTMATKTNLTAWVNFDRWYMMLQEYGGIRVGRRRMIAVPIDPALRRSIPTNMRPKVLMAQADLGGMLSGGISQRRRYAITASYGKGFILKSGGNLYIATRMGRSTAKKRMLRGQHDPDLKILYVLVPQTTIPKRLHMYETVQQVTRSEFNRLFAEAMTYAIRTAR